MLLVTGASGHLGSLIHAGLAERGLAPLAGTRTPVASPTPGGPWTSTTRRGRI